MTITGNDVLYIRFHREFNEFVVIRVILNDR